MVINEWICSDGGRMMTRETEALEKISYQFYTLHHKSKNTGLGLNLGPHRLVAKGRNSHLHGSRPIAFITHATGLFFHVQDFLSSLICNFWVFLVRQVSSLD
jgi:hypothetical protein